MAYNLLYFNKNLFSELLTIIVVIVYEQSDSSANTVNTLYQHFNHSLGVSVVRPMYWANAGHSLQVDRLCFLSCKFGGQFSIFID